MLLPPTTPFTDHSTDLSAALVTELVNVTVCRHLRVIVRGEIATAIGVFEEAAVKCGGRVTVSAQTDAFSAPTVASILAVPTPVAVTWPRVLILATRGLLVFQFVTALPWASGRLLTDLSE
jgi:hypothetical protein